MKIEKLNIAEITEYENNAKLHPREQIEQIKKSIQQKWIAPYYETVETD